MKLRKLSTLAVIAMLITTVLVPVVGLRDNSSFNESYASDSNTNETDLCSNDADTNTSDVVSPTNVTPLPNNTTNQTFAWNDTDDSVNESVDVVFDSMSKPDSNSKPVIIMFKEESDAELVKQHGGKIKSAYRLKPALAASLPQKAIDKLRNNPRIEFVADDLQIFTMAETLDWGVDRIDADVVHDYNKGAGVKVAIMDTGIVYNHPDLAANYEGGYDFGGDFSGAPNDNDPMDFNGHGTHCAGSVAAVKDNGIGIIGVAPEADLYAVKVFSDDGYGSYSDVIEALEFCIDTRTDSDQDNDIQVISMSFGSEYSAGDPGIESWIDAAFDAGILLVGAGGNEGNIPGIGDNVIYPARYGKVIAVAATDSSDDRASFSSTGSAVELAAPGVSIYSTYSGGGYAAMSGTSMACPMVSGTAALVIASNFSLTNVDVRMRLQETAEDFGAAEKDTKYGYGFINASEAALPTGSLDESPVVATPGTYDNTTLEEKTVFERNDSMFINVSISDVNGASDLNTVLITILNTTSAAILNNDTMTQDIPITGGYVYNYSWMVPGDADSGTWTIEVYANDTLGNVGSASVQFAVDITNATVPENKNITVDLIAMKKDFVLNENPEFKFIVNYNTTDAESKANETDASLSALDFDESQKALKTFLVTSGETVETAVYYKNELLDIEPEIEKIGEGDFSIKIPSQRAFRAGLYKLKVELVKDNVTYVEEQDFTWGVLAINTHKSIYLPDETAFIGMAVLDNEGHMVCDAEVTLTITDPDNKETVLSTGNGLIKVSPECCVYGVTNLPDYYTNYVVGGVGTYVMNLTAVTPDGTKSITDNFNVQSSVDFDVTRDGPTRIYPPVPYVMNFTIKANENYTGAITEKVPASFSITPQDDLTVTTVGDTKILSWNKNLIQGETYNLAYEFDAPDISPYLFVIGELEIGTWQEARRWQIAADSPEVNIYNFATCTHGTDCWAYENDVDQFPFGGDTGNRNDHDEPTGEDYGYISAVDSDNWLTNDPGANDEMLLWLEFNINLTETPISSIALINFSFYGHSDGNKASDFMIWVLKDGEAWEEDASWVQQGGSLSIVEDVDTWLNRSMNSDFATYINSSTGKITWAVFSSISSEDMRINYVEVGITYTPPDNTPPTYSNDADNSTGSVTEGEIVNTHVYWADAYDGNTLSKAVLRTNKTGGWTNESWHAFTIDQGWANITIDTTGYAGKTICWVQWANDTSNNWNTSMSTTAHCFNVAAADTTSPTWQNQGQNNSAPAEGEAVLLYAQGKDETALDFAVLETNETGGWLNITDGSYGSPKDMGDATDWTWSNFTWQNSSITAGTTVGWRIWYNDTSDNRNKTDIMSFTVQSADNNPPEWSNAQTNKTPVYENDSVKFTANWTDDIALAGYKFSTNQTGTWVNSSFISFSGTSNTSKNVTQITASAGTTVGWRFYANDTSDNWNVTDIQSFVVASPLPPPPPPSTPYLIYGWVFYKNGTACNNPVVNITNMNNSKQWQAERNASYNYYQLILANGTDLNASEILRFTVRDSSGVQSKMFDHTVNEAEVNNGGLFGFNITLVSPETPFMIYGWVNYSNGSACNNPSVNITNTNTSTQWQAETHSGYNFYQLILDTTNISVGNVLEFNATDGSQYNVTNHTVTQGEINNGGLFDFNLTLPVVADTIPPEWRNQGQNVSQIPVGGSILLYAQGKDTVALDYAVLATNETGTWHNWTNKYGSPMDMQDVVDIWKWSNFTWQNGSVTAGTTVGWRIWYNDTANNWNKTDIMSFSVMAGASPTVDSITITPDDSGDAGVQINPNPGANKTVNISAVVSDPNGWEDIDTVVANITGQSTVTDSPVNLTFISNSTLTTATYNGTFNMSFYYHNGTYTVDVTATDNGSTSSSNSTYFDYQTLRAMELDTSTINFSISGPIDPGVTRDVPGDEDMSTLNNATVRNTGNVEIDMEISGTNMTYGSNEITKDNIEAQIDDTLGYQNLSAARCFDVNMTVGELSLKNADFKLFVPYGTSQGGYSGTITLTVTTC